MGKKRRIFWIVGTVGVAGALLIAVTFVFDYNSTDAKIERAVTQIVEEYGFEFEDQHRDYANSSGRAIIANEYCRVPMDSESAEDVFSRLRSVIHDPEDNNSKGNTNVGQFFTGEEHRGRVYGVVFLLDSKVLIQSDWQPAACIHLIHYDDRLNLWERIKSLWPW